MVSTPTKKSQNDPSMTTWRKYHDTFKHVETEEFFSWYTMEHSLKADKMALLAFLFIWQASLSLAIDSVAFIENSHIDLQSIHRLRNTINSCMYKNALARNSRA